MTANDEIFLKNCWYVAAWDHELIDGTKLARTILEQPVVLYRGESGRVMAMEDRCCHRGAPLSMGRVEGDCIRCMYHGMKFDPSGKCIQIPGQEVIPARLGVRSALPGGARIDEAIALLGELSRRNELTDFLTLPAYDRID